MKKKVLFTVLFLASMLTVSAQRVAVKNNLAYDLTLTPNLALEVGMGPKWTFDLTAGWNPFQVLKDNKHWKHWLVQPEFRYWFCERFNGWFVGAHLHAGQMGLSGIKWPAIGYVTTSNYIFNKDPQMLVNGQWIDGKEPSPFADRKDSRYEGWFGGAGLSVGYQWVLNNHWNFEASIGGGWVHLLYDKYKCEKCGTKLTSNQEADYFGITRATLSIVYLIR